jgi:hypothetical protein
MEALAGCDHTRAGPVQMPQGARPQGRRQGELSEGRVQKIVPGLSDLLDDGDREGGTGWRWRVLSPGSPIGLARKTLVTGDALRPAGGRLRARLGRASSDGQVGHRRHEWRRSRRTPGATRPSKHRDPACVWAPPRARSTADAIFMGQGEPRLMTQSCFQLATMIPNGNLLSHKARHGSSIVLPGGAMTPFGDS